MPESPGKPICISIESAGKKPDKTMTNDRNKAKKTFDYDVIVAGGGPAGSTAATLLARYGHSVLLLERDRHPRFHIGESMLPNMTPIMDRLGMDWKEGNLRKQGAEFIDESTAQRISFSFESQAPAYQVERARFDARLFENAAKQGADTRQNEEISKVDCHTGGISATSSRAIYRCRYFIDATGRSILMGRAQKSIRRLHNLGRFALYSCYGNAGSPAAARLFETGIIQIVLLDIGWLWIIPLTGQRLSIGLVVKANRPQGVANSELFQRTIDGSPTLTELLEGAEPIFQHRVEADFSYINRKRHGLRYACCGDAAGFLDPVFSSGVFFSVKSAEMIADRLHPALTEGREGDPNLLLPDDAVYKHGFETMQRMIERFYHSGLVHNLFFEADREQRIKTEVTCLLAGDLWSQNNFFQQGLLAGRRGNVQATGNGLQESGE
jgi:flavin-dependent dehydrogenase